MQNLSAELAERFVTDFGDGSTNLLKRLKENPFVFEDWYGSIQSGFKRIQVKGRLNQLGEYALESLNGVKLKWKTKADGFIDFGRREDLRELLKVSSEGIEAHHKIPWNICENDDIIQKAALDGFHPNMLENGIPLTKYTSDRRHFIEFDGAGHANHPSYDKWIQKQLNDWRIAKGGNFSAEEANSFLQKRLIPQIEQHINNAKIDPSSKNLNDYFKRLLNE